MFVRAEMIPYSWVHSIAENQYDFLTILGLGNIPNNSRY